MTASEWRAGSPSGHPHMARMCCSNCEHSRPARDRFAKQISHDRVGMGARIAEGPPADGAYVLLDLRAEAGVRGQIPGIVHPWCDLVDEQPLSPARRHDEHLDRKDADMVER